MAKRKRTKAAKTTPKAKTARRKKRRTAAAGGGRRKKRTPTTRRRGTSESEQGRVVGLVRELIEHHETGPAVSAGDVDADWQRAESSGEEAVGGSVSTPDQDVVDEIGHALGVEQPSAAPLRTSEEILEDRDRRYWEYERRAQGKAARRREP